MNRSKRTTKKHFSRLVKAWRKANDIAWSTVSAPGPVFTNTSPGPDKNRAWEEHHDRMESWQQDAAEMCREALAAAPSWFRENKVLLKKAFDKAFTCNGCAVMGPGIPSLPSLMSVAE